MIVSVLETEIRKLRIDRSGWMDSEITKESEKVRKEETEKGTKERASYNKEYIKSFKQLKKQRQIQ